MLEEKYRIDLPIAKFTFFIAYNECNLCSEFVSITEPLSLIANSVVRCM